MKKQLFILLFITKVLYGQISPGELSKFHADLEGLNNCTKCHTIGEKVTNQKCLSCHKEIDQRIKNNTGFHSSNDVKGKDCRICHSEHNGRNFQIVHFDKNKFDHSKTGFTLKDSHSGIDCFKCHKNEFIIDDEIRKKKESYLGLSKECFICHEDAHKKTLGNDCASCHDYKKFKPASNFDHDNSKFRLTGAHVNVICEKCHPKEDNSGKVFQKFKGLAFSSCLNCHKDVHNNKFGSDCQKCHNTTSFANINKSNFDHGKTNFALLGKHISVECSKCHGTNLTSKPKHEKCIDCHKDYHKGELKEGNEVKDCQHCHNEKGFSPSSFTFDMHNKSDFLLIGAHLATPCQNCHFKNSDWRFKNIGIRCIDCHQNIHGNEISARFMGNNSCDNCHNTNLWDSINFDHNKTNFVLLGKHSTTTCDKCHLEEKMNGKKEFLFISLNPDCESCHKDVHNGQFIENGSNNCQQCHSFNNWSPEKFDHNKTNFPITGAHLNVTCSKCHKEVEGPNKKYVKYKIEDFRCIVCHY